MAFGIILASLVMSSVLAWWPGRAVGERNVAPARVK